MSTPTPRSSAFFFVGRLTPPELANFNVQNLEIAGNGVVEILGPHISVWWRNEPRDEWKIRNWEHFWAGSIATASCWPGADHVTVDNSGGWPDFYGI